MVHADGPGGLDGVAVEFDDERAVADARIVLAATLARRLGIESLVDEAVDLGDRPGAANAGAKVMTLVSAMALGADCIDDCDVLRAGRTGQVLGHQVVAPSTLGTFLRAFTFGHVRQLDRVLADTLLRAWQFTANAAWTVIACLAHNCCAGPRSSDCPAGPSAPPEPSGADCSRSPAD